MIKFSKAQSVAEGAALPSENPGDPEALASRYMHESKRPPVTQFHLLGACTEEILPTFCGEAERENANE